MASIEGQHGKAEDTMMSLVLKFVKEYGGKGSRRRKTLKLETRWSWHATFEFEAQGNPRCRGPSRVAQLFIHVVTPHSLEPSQALFF